MSDSRLSPLPCTDANGDWICENPAVCQRWCEEAEQCQLDEEEDLL